MLDLGFLAQYRLRALVLESDRCWESGISKLQFSLLSSGNVMGHAACDNYEDLSCIRMADTTKPFSNELNTKAVFNKTVVNILILMLITFII